jgi:hypothetical protein
MTRLMEYEDSITGRILKELGLCSLTKEVRMT